MNHRGVTRRDLLKWGLGSAAATAALEGLGHITKVPGWSQLLSGHSLPHPHWAVKDSFQLTQLLAGAGSAGQLAALLQLQEAAAQSAQSSESDWSLITIKVFDQVYTPLVFALGQVTDSGEVQTANIPMGSHYTLSKCGNTNLKMHLYNKGIVRISDQARLKKLRFNKWFADILQTGRSDTVTDQGTGSLADFSGYLGDFPSENEVAIQAGICVQPRRGMSVHQLWHSKMRDKLPDLCHYVGVKGLVRSPLGISCFMMGESYDHNVSIPYNVVLSGTSKTDASHQVRGRSLDEIVKNISQSLSAGFADTRSTSDGQNLTYLLDQLATANPERRKAMLDSRARLETQLQELQKLSGLELQRVAYSATDRGSYGNVQADVVKVNNADRYENIDAKNEFLSHCAFVAKALEIQGQPYRNFSLFMNLNDLDGKDIDDPKNPSTVFKAKALNYVEGMRQLALGLNMLGRAIRGKKALVVVISDGGRNFGMGDGNGPSFSMLLGPGDKLADQLFAPNQYISQSFAMDAGGYDSAKTKFGNLGDVSTGFEWDNESFGSSWGLHDSTGKPHMTGEKAASQTDTGDWQGGVFEFLCEQQGRMDLMRSGEVGRYVRFRRKV